MQGNELNTPNFEVNYSYNALRNSFRRDSKFSIYFFILIYSSFSSYKQFCFIAFSGENILILIYYYSMTEPPANAPVRAIPFECVCAVSIRHTFFPDDSYSYRNAKNKKKRIPKLKRRTFRAK